MAAPVLQFKRGNAGVAGTVPALRPGEPAISLNNFDFFIGIDTSVANNKFFGSHRYWGREDGTEALKLKLVDKDGINSINLKSPDTLVGTTTYTLPETIIDTYFLKTNSLGVLEWSNEFPNIEVTEITAGIATFTDTTDNILGDADTGAVQIDGGLGVNKNVTVGGNLNVQGHSEFVGVVTFKGGTINLGDEDTDDINVAGEFISNLVPNTDDTYDIGVGGKRWRSANFSGVSTFNNVTVGGASTALLVNGDTRIIGILTVGSASVTFSGVNNEIAGITTFTGFSDFNEGINVDGHTDLDNLAVSGVSTFTGAVRVLSSVSANNFIATTTTLQAPTAGNYVGERLRLYDFNDPLKTNYAIGVEQNNVWFGVDSNLDGQGFKWYGGTTDIARLGGTGNFRIAGNLSVQGTGISTFAGLIDGNGGLDITGQTTLNNNLTVSGVSTFTGTIDANGGADISGGETTLSSATVSDLTSGRVVLAGTSGSLEDSANLTFGSGGLTIGAGGINVTGVSTFSADVTVGGDITVGGNDIKASDGAVALTLAPTTGAVTAANDLTVNGNLYVAGSTTQVNTAALTVEDRTIDLGIVNGATPATATTWDLGVLFNYHAGGSAKKSAVIWEHEDSRFKFASVLGADTNGTDNNTPQLTVTTFAPIEIAELWVNNSCTGGTQQVIGCVGSELQLQNITLDAGTF